MNIKMKACWFAAAGIVLAGLLVFPCRPALSADAETNRKAYQVLFYASFDGTADADYASGDKTALYGDVAFEPGIAGKAVRIKTLGVIKTLSYSTDKNFDIANGSVAFWYKPDWSAEKNHHTLFSTNKDWIQPGMMLLCWWSNQDSPGWGWGFYGSGSWAVKKRDLFGCLYQANDTNLPGNGQWLHFVITWEEGKQPLLYVNGDAQTGVAGQPDYAWKVDESCKSDRFILGSSFNGSASAAGLYDDLIVFGKALSPSEVKSIYERKVVFK